MRHSSDRQRLTAHDRFALALLSVFLLVWTVSGINPSFRSDWILENVIVFLAVPALMLTHRRMPLSKISYGAIFVFLCLHEVGAHYTYAMVPYDQWFEALTGMIYAGLSLEGMEEHVDPAVRALARDCAAEIDEMGGLPTRNPEELLEVFTLLTWAALSLGEAGKTPPIEVLDAIIRIAPTLRALRHSDGGLARFHGGGRQTRDCRC